MNNVKQVIVVRKDLNMRKGKIAAQVAHASMKVILDLMNVRKSEHDVLGDSRILSERSLLTLDNQPLEAWLSGAFTKIVVSCDSQEELEAIEQICTDREVHHAKIVDNGWTEFKGVPTVTCLAVGPDNVDVINEITGHLKLL